MDEAMLAAAAERAALHANIAAGERPVFVVTVGELALLITLKDEPYGDPAAAPADLAPPLRQAVTEHRAAIMIDLQAGAEEDNPHRAYEVIGPLLSEMIPLGSTIYWPDRDRFASFDEDARNLLRSEAPLVAFADRGRRDIIDAPRDHPGLKEAEQEARSKWSDFVKACSDRNRRERCLVKAYFRYGDRREAMWVSPESIDGETISGMLENEPRAILNLRQGSRVTFSLDDVSDWVYARDGEMLGGFTEKVLKE